MAIAGFDYDYFINELVAYVHENIPGLEDATDEDVTTLINGLYPTLDPGEAAAQQCYIDYGKPLGLYYNESQKDNLDTFFVQDEYILAAEAHRDAWVENKIAANPFLTEAAAIKQYDDLLNANPYQHYLDIGAALGVNPSNAFDESLFIQSVLDYFEIDMTVEEGRKVFIEALGDPLSVYIDIVAANNMAETFPALPVPEDEQVDTNIPPVPTTATLTHSVDELTANIFNAPRVWNPDDSDQMNSLNDDDVLTGTGSNPTLNFTFVNDSETGDRDIMPELNGIETINVAFTADGRQTLDLQDATGLKVVNASRIDDTTGIIVNLDNIQAALTDLSITSSNSPTALFSATFSDKALRTDTDPTTEDTQSLNLKLDNAQLAQLLIEEITVNVAGDQGYETINLNSTGSANAVAAMVAEDIQKLIITGDADLTIGSLNEAGSLTTVDASALKASLDYTIDAGVMGAPPDGTSNGSVAFSLTGTVNNDTVRISDQVQLNDTIAAGNGTDTIIITHSDGLAATINTTNFFANGTAEATGFEAVSIVRSVDADPGEPTVVDNAVMSVDMDQMSGDQTISLVNLENEGSNVIYDLDNATAAEAAAITIKHSGSSERVAGDNGVTQNVIDLDVASGVTTAAVTIQNGTNNVPGFNFILTADSDAEAGAVDSASVNTVANITITDSDNESNSVRLTEFAAHTGTITVAAGLAGTYMNLDSTGSNNATASGFRFDQTGFGGGVTNADYYNATTGPFGNAGNVYSDIGTANAERLVASTINAAEFAGNLIVRVGEKNQTITTGTGNDTIIFDAVGKTDASRLTGGLNISDKVAMGAGYDMVVIDGNVYEGEVIGLADTEWTNLTGVDVIRLGNAGLDQDVNGANDAAKAAPAYRLSLSNSLIDQTDAGDRITIINSDGILGSAAGSAATINMRALNNANFVDFYGANGNGIVESVNTIQVNEVTMSGNSALNGGDNNVVQSYTSTDMNTRFGITTATSLDANLAWAVVAGQTTAAAAAAAVTAANLVTLGSGALTAANFNALAVLPDLNNNVLEIYNAAEITVGDLAKVSNFGTIDAINDTGTEQLLNITLTDTIVDSLVDASHVSSSSQTEIIDLKAYDNPTNAGAFERVNLQANTLTSKSGVHALLGRGADVVQTGAGNDVVVMAGNYIKGTYTVVDATTGFNMDSVANWADDSDDDNDGNVDIGADGIAGTADDDVVMTKLVVTDNISLGTGTDTLIAYGAIDLTAASISGVENLILYSSATIDASDLAKFTTVTFAGTQNHTLTIRNDGVGAQVDLSHLYLTGSGSLTIAPDAGTTTGSTSDIIKTTAGPDGILGGSFAADDVTATGTITASGITTAMDDALTATGTGAMTITFAQLTGNDIAASSTAVPTITGVSSATGGTVNSIDFAAKTITFTPSAVGTAGFDYTLSDGSGTDIGHATITVTSTDTVAPGLATTGFFSPADDATSVAIDSNVVITFNETVAIGTGTIGLYDVTTDTLVPAAVTVTGTTLTINPTGNLANNTAYYVNIAAGAVKDTASLSYAGITGETTFNFTTIAAGGTPSSTVAVSGAGTSDASTGNVTYTIASGTYTYTIDKFAAGDKLDVIAGAVVNVVPDASDTDGSQTITVSDGTTGATATIILTGITSAQDAGLFNAGSIDTVFGAGTVI